MRIYEIAVLMVLFAFIFFYRNEAEGKERGMTCPARYI